MLFKAFNFNFSLKDAPTAVFPSCAARPTYHPDLAVYIPYAPEVGVANYSRYPSLSQLREDPHELVDMQSLDPYRLFQSVRSSGPRVAAPLHYVRETSSEQLESSSKDALEEQKAALSSHSHPKEKHVPPPIVLSLPPPVSPLSPTLPPVHPSLPPPPAAYIPLRPAPPARSVPSALPTSTSKPRSPPSEQSKPSHSKQGRSPSRSDVKRGSGSKASDKENRVQQGFSPMKPRRAVVALGARNINTLDY